WRLHCRDQTRERDRPAYLPTIGRPNRESCQKRWRRRLVLCRPFGIPFDHFRSATERGAQPYCRTCEIRPGEDRAGETFEPFSLSAADLSMHYAPVLFSFLNVGG